MTTGVDILFKELPASANAVDRFSKPDTSTAKADNTDSRSYISENKDDYKTSKSFTEHLDRHNTSDDLNRNNDASTKPNYHSEKNQEQSGNSQPVSVEGRPDNKVKEIPSQVSDNKANSSQPVIAENKTENPSQEVALINKELLAVNNLPQQIPTTNSHMNGNLAPEVKDTLPPESVLQQNINSGPTTPNILNANVSTQQVETQTNSILTTTPVAPEINSENIDKNTPVNTAQNEIKVTQIEPAQENVIQDKLAKEISQNQSVVQPQKPHNKPIDQNGLSQNGGEISSENKLADGQSNNVEKTSAPVAVEKTTPLLAEAQIKPQEIIPLEQPLECAIQATVTRSEVLPNGNTTETVAVERTRAAQALPVVPVQSQNSILGL